MKPALYFAAYAGRESFGGAAIYIGHGIMSGVDVGGCVYDGEYQIANDTIRVKASLTAPQEGGLLVTGQKLEPMQVLELKATWSREFTGKSLDISVGGRSVAVSFRKVRDLP